MQTLILFFLDYKAKLKCGNRLVIEKRTFHIPFYLSRSLNDSLYDFPALDVLMIMIIASYESERKKLIFLPHSSSSPHIKSALRR